jgi:hypothetical protein
MIHLLYIGRVTTSIKVIEYFPFFCKQQATNLIAGWCLWKIQKLTVYTTSGATERRIIINHLFPAALYPNLTLVLMNYVIRLALSSGDNIPGWKTHRLALDWLFAGVGANSILDLLRDPDFGENPKFFNILFTTTSAFKVKLGLTPAWCLYNLPVACATFPSHPLYITFQWSRAAIKELPFWNPVLLFACGNEFIQTASRNLANCRLLGCKSKMIMKMQPAYRSQTIN